MIGLLGKKLGMTQIFDPEGRSIPVTVLQAGPCHVTSIRSQDKNGYTGIQLGFEQVRDKVLTKPVIGQFKKAGIASSLRFVREIRTPEAENLQVGSQVGVDNFSEGDYVDVEGVTIGKGFQGVVKRHNFRAGEKAHGTKMGREPGSIGASAFPSRVIKGKKLPGHMGNVRQTTQNLKVVKVDAENQLLLVRGAVPGKSGAYLVIRTSLKRGKAQKWKTLNAQGSAAQTPPAAGKSSKEASS